MTPLAFTKRILFVTMGMTLALSLYTCDLFNQKQYRFKVTNSNGEFTGIYAVDGESSKSFTSKSVNGTAYDFSKELDFESVEVQATYTGTATSFMKITVYENGVPLSSATRCSENFTLTMTYTPENGGEEETTSNTDNDSGGDGKTIFTDTTSSDDCDSTTSASNTPDAPDGLDLEVTGTTSIKVTIDDPNDSTIISYNVYYTPDGGTQDSENYQVASEIDTSVDGEISMVLSGLTTNTQYTIYVTAVSDSESSASSSLTATTD